MKRFFACLRDMLWHLDMAWMRLRFAQADLVLATLRTAARHQAQAALADQREMEHLPATQKQVDRLAQLAAERYLASRWQSPYLRRWKERAARGIFRSCFRETLLPSADPSIPHGGPSL